MRKELSAIRGDKPVTDGELSAAQANLTRSLPGENETTPALASTLSQSVVFDLPDDYYDSYVERIRGLDRSTLENAARTMIDAGGLTWVVVGDLDQIESSIRALGWGKVDVVDPAALVNQQAAESADNESSDEANAPTDEGTNE